MWAQVPSSGKALHRSKLMSKCEEHHCNLLPVFDVLSMSSSMFPVASKEAEIRLN